MFLFIKFVAFFVNYQQVPTTTCLLHYIIAANFASKTKMRKPQVMITIGRYLYKKKVRRACTINIMDQTVLVYTLLVFRKFFIIIIAKSNQQNRGIILF